MKRPSVISKLLSANDVGHTGGHQAGILIPKQSDVLPFFPSLDASQKNPRVMLTFIDDWGDTRSFAFIYYNSKYFGGTRNEYRLTRMTSFLRSKGASPGDTAVFTRSSDGAYRVSVQKAQSATVVISKALKLGNSWKVVRL